MTAHPTFGNTFRLVAALAAGVLLVATADVAFARSSGGSDHGDRDHDGDHHDHGDWGHDGDHHHHHHQVPVHGPGSSHNPVVYHAPHPAGLMGQEAVKGLKPDKVKVIPCRGGGTGGGGGGHGGGGGGIYGPPKCS
jgi:hypothetical protein